MRGEEKVCQARHWKKGYIEEGKGDPMPNVTQVTLREIGQRNVVAKLISVRIFQR